jgi:hypothetical protein
MHTEPRNSFHTAFLYDCLKPPNFAAILVDPKLHQAGTYTLMGRLRWATSTLKSPSCHRRFGGTSSRISIGLDCRQNKEYALGQACQSVSLAKKECTLEWCPLRYMCWTWRHAFSGDSASLGAVYDVGEYEPMCTRSLIWGRRSRGSTRTESPFACRTSIWPASGYTFDIRITPSVRANMLHPGF